MNFIQTELLTKHSWCTDFHWKPTPTVEVKNESVTCYNIILYTVLNRCSVSTASLRNIFKKRGDTMKETAQQMTPSSHTRSTQRHPCEYRLTQCCWKRSRLSDGTSTTEYPYWAFFLLIFQLSHQILEKKKKKKKRERESMHIHDRVPTHPAHTFSPRRQKHKPTRQFGHIGKWSSGRAVLLA